MPAFGGTLRVIRATVRIFSVWHQLLQDLPVLLTPELELVACANTHAVSLGHVDTMGKILRSTGDLVGERFPCDIIN